MRTVTGAHDTCHGSCAPRVPGAAAKSGSRPETAGWAGQRDRKGPVPKIGTGPSI
ncbi:hypothetical protein SSCG_02532 [Streptomyces clavuligerus]|nr:hypothetical protein SSCG_02532 [Streptomyces clavuligerus]